MRRGDIWTVAARGAYTGKPRPAVIVQDDRFDATDSVTVCVMTTDPTSAPLLRLPVAPSAENGLAEHSRLKVDKITTVPRANLKEHIGRLAGDDLAELGRAVVVFLGLA